MADTWKQSLMSEYNAAHHNIVIIARKSSAR